MDTFVHFPKEFIASFTAATGHLTAVIFEVFSVPPNQPKVNDSPPLICPKKTSAISLSVGYAVHTISLFSPGRDSGISNLPNLATLTVF